MNAPWKARHEGSPEHVELPLILLQQGILDGEWELTDEVQGPGEASWQAIEEHPQFAELALDIEEPPPAQHDEEGHLDMNALIDVCMVLLIFFILTTSVAALQKQMEAPSISEGKVNIPVLTKEVIQEQMIHIIAKVEDGQTVITMEGQPVALDDLFSRLRGIALTSKKTGLLLEHDDFVSQDTVVQIIDKAKAAGLGKVHMVVK